MTDQKIQVSSGASLLSGKLAKPRCNGYCADLGCDNIAIIVPGGCATWKQYCAQCETRIKRRNEFLKEQFG